VKVPGPWKDEARPGSETDEDDETQHEKSYRAKLVEAPAGIPNDPELQGFVIPKRKDLVEKKQELLERFRKNTERLLDKKYKSRADMEAVRVLNKKAPQLRDFRYDSINKGLAEEAI